MSKANRIFLLSPARIGGERTKFLLNPAAQFPLAIQFRRQKLTLGEAFTFLSGLYFRGKIAYCARFGNERNTFVISSNRGLLPIATKIGPNDLKAMADTPIELSEPDYRAPLEQTANRLLRLNPSSQVVLLGSIASKKYVDILLPIFGPRLLFPVEFIGRGDMSRGGLLLRHAANGEELTYLCVEGAVRHGKRPPKLPRMTRQK